VARVGVINISDGRDYVHNGIADFIVANEDKLVRKLEAAGHEVVRAREPVAANTLATTLAREVEASTSPSCTTASGLHDARRRSAHQPAAAARQHRPGPAGHGRHARRGCALDQIGREHTRLWGDPEDDALIERIGVRATAAAAVRAARPGGW
jgi:L-fucose isomerase